MRYHDRFTLYDPRYAVAAAPAIDPERLVSARLEPTLSARYEAVLDLVFRTDGGYLPLGLALVEGAMLVEREASPFVWPMWLRGAADEPVLVELERRIEPWLQSLVLARFENDVRLRRFTGDPAVVEDLDRAASLSLFGAAPYVEVMRALAPYVYAARFTGGKHAGIASAGGANGAAFLYGRARSVALATGSPETDAFVAQWFGDVPLEAYDHGKKYDVAIGEASGEAPVRIACGAAGTHTVTVARALPLTALATFDPDDSILDYTFDVTVAAAAPLRHSMLHHPDAVGGSGGRIAIMVRDDWQRIPDADTDAVTALRDRLQGEGFVVNVVPGSAPIEPAAVDLAHVIGTDHAAVIAPVLGRLRASNVPIVMTPFIDDPAGEGIWGSGVTPFAYRGSNDMATLDMYLDGLARRRLVADNAPQPPTQGGPLFDPAVRAMLALATCVLASTQEEERIIRDAFGYAGEIAVAAPLIPQCVASDPAFAAGTGDFVLVHAPLDARTGTVAMVRAARDSGLPVLFTGPVANSEIHSYVHAYLGGQSWYVPPAALDAGALEGLYARARVYAGVTWLGRGLSRFVRAAAYGAGLAASASSTAGALFPQTSIADPGSPATIVAALREAWDRAPVSRDAKAREAAVRADQGAAFRAVVNAYAVAGRSLAVS